MDIQKSFTFPFEDKDWITKLGLGALISLVPILNFAWTGYMIEIIRNVRDGAVQPLPTWDDIGKRFTDGLILFAASLVYGLPALLLLGVPTFMLISAGAFSGDHAMRDASQILAGVGGALLFAVLCVVVIYSLLLSVIYPAILVIFAREGTFASCFKLNEIMQVISRNSGPFFTAWGMSILAALLVGVVVSFVTAVLGWIPCIGWIVSIVVTFGSTVYVTSVQSHLFGQLGAVAAGNS